jgi:hypothetical protein
MLFTTMPTDVHGVSSSGPGFMSILKVDTRCFIFLPDEHLVDAANPELALCVVM